MAGRRSRSRHMHLYGKRRIDRSAAYAGSRTAGRMPREKGGRPLGLQIYGPGSDGVVPSAPAPPQVDGRRTGCKDALPRQVPKYFVTLSVAAAAAGWMEGAAGRVLGCQRRTMRVRAAGGGHGRKRQGKLQALTAFLRYGEQSSRDDRQWRVRNAPRRIPSGRWQ